MSASPKTHTLDWEDAAPGAGRWWMARAREVTAAGVRDFFIAEDDTTESIVGLLRVPPQSHYTVVAAVFLDRFESRAAAAAALKADVAAALTDTDRAAAVRRALLLWRCLRAAAILRRNAPVLLLGLAGGALLGLGVAFFTLWSEASGWPIVAAGVGLGAAVGLMLKLAVDAARVRVGAEPWGRFAVLMLGVAAGAAAAAAGALVRFWH